MMGQLIYTTVATIRNRTSSTYTLVPFDKSRITPVGGGTISFSDYSTNYWALSTAQAYDNGVYVADVEHYIFFDRVYQSQSKNVGKRISFSSSYIRILASSPTKKVANHTGYTQDGVSYVEFVDQGLLNIVILERDRKTFNATYNPGSKSSGSTYTSSWLEDNVEGAVFRGATYTRNGYRQIGWNSVDDSATVEYEFSTKITANSNLVLYPVWKAITSTVTLDKQSGSGGTSTVSATYDAAMPTITPPTRTGYTFGGYWTGTGGSGTQYYNANGSSARNWDKTVNTTLYAKWTIITSVVTLDKQSGTGGTSSVTATYGVAMPSATMPTRTGYTFGGYFDAISGGVQYYTSAGASARNWNKTTNTTLYAHWDEIFYLVLFDSAGGWITSGSSFIYAHYGRQLGTLPTPEWDGYTFVGWFTQKTGGTQVTETTVFSGTSDTTYYAHWVSAGGKKYSVSFIDPTGTNATATREYDVGSAGTARLPWINSGLGWAVPAGYTLNQNTTWTTSFGDGTIYANNQLITSDLAEEGYTAYLYALWNPQSHQVTFNYDGGAVVESSRSILHGNQIGRLPETIKNGIKSVGWKISGTQTQVTSTYIVTSNITLVPIWGESANEEFWSVVRYKIDLVLNGGVLDSAYVAKYSKGYSKALPTDSQITKSGHTFGGWYLTASFSGERQSVVPKGSSGTMKYYAKWI